MQHEKIRKVDYFKNYGIFDLGKVEVTLFIKILHKLRKYFCYCEIFAWDRLQPAGNPSNAEFAQHNVFMSPSSVP